MGSIINFSKSVRLEGSGEQLDVTIEKKTISTKFSYGNYDDNPLLMAQTMFAEALNEWGPIQETWIKMTGGGLSHTFVWIFIRHGTEKRDSNGDLYYDGPPRYSNIKLDYVVDT